MEYALIVLYPPANVESWLGQIQIRLSSEAGVVSALALPAVLPLCYLPVERCRKLFRKVLRGVSGAKTGFLITGGDLALVKEPVRKAATGETGSVVPCQTSFFYKVGLAGSGTEVVEAIRAAGEKAWEQKGEATALSSVRWPLPLFSFGFFLGQIEGGVTEQGLKDKLQPWPALRFSVFTYELLALRTAEPPQPWYKEVFWEVVDRFKVRRPA